MFSPDQYELLDFGEGRRLERFAQIVLDRICPSAENIRKKMPDLWKNADAVFRADVTSEKTQKNSKNSSVLGERGSWQPLTEAGRAIFVNIDAKNQANSKPWSLRYDQVTFELRGTPFGHVGLFPEQAENWDSIKRLCQMFVTTQKTVQDSCPPNEKTGPRVLNLFGYTGGSTLAAAFGGAVVTHVDAAKNVVAWAQKNAEISQLSQFPIRWIAEDASKFVRRELKRGNSYHGIILDPPSYGHGTHGEVWRLSAHLSDLLFDCFSLLELQFSCFLLLTCHTPDYTLPRLTKMLAKAAADAVSPRFSKSTQRQAHLEQKTLTLQAKSGEVLPSGESLLYLLQ
ncbi:MAG: class I SAM-dependent methyltransferase [Planctomycetaceae bacterium]|nr:class I SAM-dependent methyltransferase [Planctomycetaceae bacterium]